ncbi:MAG: DUF1775 domain-containing protein [Gemmatimonadaceae bacterium]
MPTLAVRSVHALTLLLLLPAAAHAHAVVYPRTAAPGAYERYVLRVPNEKNVATTRVELRFPAGVRVTSFGDVSGWTLETLTDSAGNITAAVWTGTLPPKRFVELPFVAVNPKTATRIVWPAYQTYADGERVEWTGPADSKRPASATEIGASASAPAAAGGDRTALLVAGAALVLSLVSLGLALRRG